MSKQQQMNTTEIGHGWDVLGSDGDKIGDIAAIQPHYINVESGFLFKKDVYIPTSAITSVEDKKVYLNVTKDQIENMDWEREPEMTEQHREVAGYNEQLKTTGKSTGDTMHIPLSEEHLNVSKREVDRGSVHVHKDVIEEQESVDVTLREEEVQVRRHASSPDNDLSGDVAADAFQEQDIDIPIHGEEAQISKSARVVEEVDVSKVGRDHTETVSDTVRREEVTVDGENTGKRDRKPRQ